MGNRHGRPSGGSVDSGMEEMRKGRFSSSHSKGASGSFSESRTRGSRKLPLSRHMSSLKGGIRVANILRRVDVNPHHYASRKKLSMHTQRYRECFNESSVAVLNPKFADAKVKKPTRTNTRIVRKKKQEVKLLESKQKPVTMKQRSLTEIATTEQPKEHLLQKSKTTFSTFRLPKQIYPDPPFALHESIRDYRSLNFSSIQISEQEQKVAAVNMILCTITPEVILKEKLNMDVDRLQTKKSHKTLTTQYSSAISSSFRSLKKRMTDVKQASPESFYVSENGKSVFNVDVPKYITSEVRKAVVEFVDEVANAYTNTRYHGFKHAVDVTQMMFMMLFYIHDRLEVNQQFTLIISCLCHDIGHFGANNAFLKKFKGSPFIERFGTESTMEYFHVHTMKRIIEKSRLFGKDFMTPEVKESFLGTATELILATDMEKHKRYMEDIEVEEEKMRISRQIDPNNFKFDDKLGFPYIILCMKLCDIANVSRVFDDAQEWSNVLSVEMESCGKIFNDETSTVSKDAKLLCSQNIAKLNKLREENAENNSDAEFNSNFFQIGESITSQCLIDFQDHVVEKIDQSSCCTLTMGFIEKIAYPMAELLQDHLPEAHSFVITRMHSNAISWGKLVKDYEMRNSVALKSAESPVEVVAPGIDNKGNSV